MKNNGIFRMLAAAVLTMVLIGAVILMLGDSADSPGSVLGQPADSLYGGAAASGKPGGSSSDGGGDAPFSFFIISDLHINGDGSYSADNVAKALKDIERFKPKADALIMTGDVTDYGREKDYMELGRMQIWATTIITAFG